MDGDTPPSVENGPATTEAHLVSGSSAFWALFAIVVNNISQEKGQFLGLCSPRYGPSLASSPLLCLADVFWIIYKLSAGVYNGLSLVDSAKAVSKLRGLDSRDDQALLAWFITWVGQIVAWLQFVKLLACAGIPGTKTLAIISMAHFIITGAVKWLNSREEDGEVGAQSAQVLSDTGQIPFSQIYHAGATFLWGSVLWLLAMNQVFGRDNPALDSFRPAGRLIAAPLKIWIVGVCALPFVFAYGIALVLLAGISYSLSLGISDLLNRFWPKNMLTALCELLDLKSETITRVCSWILIAPLVYAALFLGPWHWLNFALTPVELVSEVLLGRNSEPFDEAFSDLIAKFLAGISILTCAALTTHVITRILLRGKYALYFNRLAKLRGDAYVWVYIFHTWTNFILAYIWYLSCFDSLTTFKPGWAEYLG